MSGLLPEITRENEAFWTGGAAGKLMIASCDACGRDIHPPQLACPKCGSREVSAKPSAGRGSIHSYTINHQAWVPGLEVPYPLAIVALDDHPGVRITARVVGCALDSVKIGAAVQVEFEPREDVFIPVFRLVEASEGKTGR